MTNKLRSLFPGSEKEEAPAATEPLPEPARQPARQPVADEVDPDLPTLRGALAIARSEVTSVLTQEARQLAEERRREFDEREQQAASELSARLVQVQQRVDERLAHWTRDLERTHDDLGEQRSG
jgi:hypothetical protein